jgi:hypothetical protein
MRGRGLGLGRSQKKPTQIPNKRTKVEINAPEFTPVISIPDIWYLVVDYFVQDDLARFSLVCVSFQKIATPIISSINSFLRMKATEHSISKEIFDGTTLNAEHFVEDDFRGEQGYQERPFVDNFSDQGGAYFLKQHKDGRMLLSEEEGGAPGDTEGVEIMAHLEPLAQKLKPVVRDGDVITVEADSNYGYRNGGRYVFHDGHIWNLGGFPDDYGTVPSFFPLEDFPITYWEECIDHNRARIFHIKGKNLIQVDDSTYNYFTRNTKGIIPFNIKYTITFQEELEQVTDGYVCGEGTTLFGLE